MIEIVVSPNVHSPVTVTPTSIELNTFPDQPTSSNKTNPYDVYVGGGELPDNFFIDPMFEPVACSKSENVYNSMIRSELVLIRVIIVRRMPVR